MTTIWFSIFGSIGILGVICVVQMVHVFKGEENDK